MLHHFPKTRLEGRAMTEARYPDDLRYHSGHGWARITDDTAEFGITWFAQDSLGEIVFVSPGRIGDVTEQGTPYGDIESVKAVSDLYAPLSGEVVEINAGIADDPTTLNKDPYGGGLDHQGQTRGSLRCRGADERRRLPGDGQAVTSYG
jgi:glycine cleavage system H protein